MTIIAIWCRHKDDNVIGIGPNIPWHVTSDFRRFKRITEGQSLIAGERTYETFPNRTLPNRKIYVLTFNAEYEVSDKQNHFVVTNAKDFITIAENLYLAGGASVYKLFMTTEESLLPSVVVDCVYQGDLDSSLQGKKIDITPCVDVLNSKYKKFSADYEQDQIITSVWVKKGDFVDLNLIGHIVQCIENKG